MISSYVARRGSSRATFVISTVLDCVGGAFATPPVVLVGKLAGCLASPLDGAVGSAVGANPVSLLIPCHRVLPGSGRSGNYRWGADRKLALLDAEQESGSDLCSLFK